MAEVAANLLVKVGADIADAQQKLGTVSDKLKDFGKSAMTAGGMMTAGVTTPIVLAGIKMGNMASDLDETKNKVSVVFGDMAGSVQDWSATATENYGLSQQAALDYAGSLGNMMVQLGGTQSDAAAFSEQMVGAAADLASFHNATGGSAEVLESMSAAFRGEYDALQKYIPTINAAAVEQKALEMSGKNSAKELTNMEKALAAQQIILEDMGPAAGDFARTSDGLANSQRIMGAEIQNLMTVMGQQLLPIFSQVVDWVRQAVSWFSNLDPNIQKVIVVVAGLAAAAGPVIVAIGAIATVIGALASPIGIVIAAIAALAVAWATDFGGIRTTVTQFWEAHLKPIFETLVAWLQDNIPVALAALSEFWQNVLLPAIQTVWSFLQQYIFPVLQTLVEVYIAAAKVELAALAAVWETVLKPAIEAVWSFLQQYVIPLIEALVNVNIAALKLALQILAGIWENVLKPAIEAVWAFLQNNVLPILGSLVSTLEGPVGSALGAAKGLFDGVSGAIDAIGGAIEGVIGWLNDLATKLGSIKLPGWLGGGSGGKSATRGFEADLAGLRDYIQQVIELFADMAGAWEGAGMTPLIASAKAFSDAIAPVFDNLRSIVDGLNALGGVAVDALGGVNQVAGLIRSIVPQIIRALAAAAQGFSTEALAAAVSLAEAGGKIGAVLGALIDGFRAVADYKPEQIGPTLNVLISQLHGVVFKLNKVAPLFTGEAVEAAAALAEAGGKIGRSLSEMIDGFVDVAGYVPAVIGPTLNTLFDQLHGLIFKISKLAGQFDAEGVDAAAAFAAAVEEIISMVKAAVDLMDRLRSYTSPALTTINAFERDMQYALERWVRWVAFTLQPLAEDIDQGTAEIIEGVVSALGASLELLGGLVDYVSPLETAIDAFMDDLAQLFRRFVQWSTGSSGLGGAGTLLGIPPELAAIFTEVMDGLGAAVDVLTALVDYVGPTDEAITNFMGDLGNLFRQFVHWVQERGLGSPQSLLEIPPELIAIFGQVMDGLASAVTTLTALTGYVGPAEGAITEFTSDYTQLFEGFVTWAETTFANVTLEATAAVGEVFGTVMTGLADAVTTLTALVDYSGPSDAAIQEFEGDYQRLFSGFATWATTVLQARGWEAVAAVGEALSAVFTGLGAAVSTLLAIVGYVGPSDHAISQFEADYQLVMTNFKRWALTTFTAETAAVVQAVGDAANSLFTGLGAAAALLISIRSYSSPTQTALNGFVTDVQSLMTTFRDFAVNQFTADSLAILNAFGSTAQTLFSAIGTALDTLAGIADYTVSGGEFDLALQRFNQNLERAINSWHTWIIDIMSPETAALVAAFSGVLSDIVDGFRDALNLLMDIDQANLPTTDELQAFLDALSGLFDAVVNNFNQAAVDLEAAGTNIQAILFSIFTNMNPQMWQAGLQTGVHFLGGLRQAMTDVGIITPLLDAMWDLAAQLEDILRAAWGISSPSKVAKRIGGQFVEGLEMGLQDLYGIPNLMRDALNVSGLGGVTVEPMPQRAYLTVRFEGAYQSGMSQRDEARITGAMVNELRRQGLTLVTR